VVRLSFGDAALTHFLYLERPEGMERMDAEGFVPAAPPSDPVTAGEIMPRRQEFATVGHLYRGILDGLTGLAARLDERALFPGPRRAQATPELFGWPQLIAVTGLDSACAAIEEIIEQGEGARGDWQPAHYGRFLGIWEEYRRLREQDPRFEPARPVMPAFTRQPFDIAEPQPLLTDQATRGVAELFNMGYEVLLQVLTRFFTHTDETDEQLGTLVQAAFGLMGGVLRPIGAALTRMPAGPEHPGLTAGPVFEMYYQMGNFVPWQAAAWALLSERVAVLSGRCADQAGRADVPDAVAPAAQAAAAISAQLAAQVPAELRPA